MLLKAIRKLLCKKHIHQWTDWMESISRGKYYGRWVHHRYCKSCGIKEQHLLKDCNHDTDTD